MKRVMTLLLALCMIFALAACGEKEPAETTPSTTQSTEPQTKEYVLLRTKADIMQGLQMTPANIDAWFEAYTTTSEEEAQNAIRWDSRKSIEYMWSKEAISGGTIVNAAMFTTTVPDDVVLNPEDDVTYDTQYIGMISKDGLTMNVAGVDLLAELPAGTTGRSITVSGVNIKVFDRGDADSENTYTSNLAGTYNLKQNQGLLTFVSDSTGVDLGILSSLMESADLIVPAMEYAGYMSHNFTDSVVHITCILNVDGKEHQIALGGTFTMSIDPASGLTAEELLSVAEDFSNTDFSGLGGLGGLEGLFGGLFSGGSGLEDLLGGGN